MAKLINRKATKSYILEKCKKTRQGWQCQRVSKTAINKIEAYIIMKINQSNNRHPTLGKTFMHFD